MNPPETPLCVVTVVGVSDELDPAEQAARLINEATRAAVRKLLRKGALLREYARSDEKPRFVTSRQVITLRVI